VIRIDQSIPLKEYNIDLTVSKLHLKLADGLKAVIDETKQQQRILEVITELVETERGYCADLVSVVEVNSYS